MSMIAVIDCSSLLSLARYYLPNDRKNKLYDFLKNKIEAGEIVIIDKILEESKFISQKLIIKKLDFLNDKKFCKEHSVGESTAFLIPHAHEKFYRMVDHNFVVRSLINDLNDAEYEVIKNDFLNSADCKMIIKAYNLLKEKEKVIVVTEETSVSNDKKPFKKIPAICKILGIKTVNIQEYFDMQDELSIEIN